MDEKNNMDDAKLKEGKNKKGDYKLILISFAIVTVIVLITLLIFGNTNKKDENKDNVKVNDNTQVVKKGTSEESIKKAYGMSKEDAISIVREIYNGESYEFTCEINSDSKYVVTVSNTATKSVSKYLVDPESKDNSFYEIDE